MTKHNMTILKGMNFLLLIFVCLVVVVSSIEAQEALPDLVARIKPSVVSIVTYDKDGKKVASGSGFCIATNRIITNKHVIEDAFRIVVHITDGKIYRVIKIDSVDTEGDLALLQTEQLVSQVKPLTIAKLSPRVGEKVFVVGNPLGLEGSVSDGIVAAFRSMQGIGKLIQITAPISPGSSGSPVINIWGEVIGVATLNLEGGQNLNFAISSERIVSLWSNQLTISNNTYSNLPTSSITEEERSKADQLYVKALALHQNKELDKALSLYQEAIQINPNFAAAYLGAGNCRFDLGQYKEASENYKQVIRIYPKESNMLFQAYTNLSYIYYNLKQYEEAIEVSKQAIRLDSLSYSAFNYLGLAYYGLKQYKDAVSPFKWAILLNSSNPSDKMYALYNLGMTYLALGDINSAMEQQKLLANLNPELAKKLLSKLNNMTGNWRAIYKDGSSDNSSIYKIVDDGNKITLQTIYKGELAVFCSGSWEGDFAFGTGGRDSNIICAFKRIDSTQLKYTNFPRNFNDSLEKAFNYAKENFEKSAGTLRKIE